MILSWFGRVFKVGGEQEWFVVVWKFLQVGERAGIHSVSTNDFVCHVSIRYSVLPRPRFTNQWFRHGLEVSPSWGESGNPLRIHQWFCMLEGWSEEDRAMLSIQSVQLTWKLNLWPICWSGTPFCQGLLLSTNDFVVVWKFLLVGERAGIHSVSTNDFVC